MAGGGGTTTLTSIPENCTAKHYWSGSSYTWADCQVPQKYSNYVYIKIFDSEGKDITESCYIDNTFDMGDGEVQKVTNYRINSNLTGSYFYFSVGGAVIDVSITLNESSNSIGNIPMGELTFNGVQSVTYNGTDYTKLVVDGTNYPPVMISFTINRKSYQAEEGMTWGEWIASSYNTDGYLDSGGMVFNSVGEPVLYNGSIISIEAVIIANHTYLLGSHSGGAN